MSGAEIDRLLESAYAASPEILRKAVAIIERAAATR
jgi:hypothetical protein